MKLSTITYRQLTLLTALLVTPAYAQWDSNGQGGPRWRVEQPLVLPQIVMDADTRNGDKCTSARSASSKLCPNMLAERSNAVFEVRGTKNRYVVAALSDVSDEYPGVEIELFSGMGLTLDNSGKGEFSLGAVIKLVDRIQVNYEQINLRYQLDFYYQ